MERGIEGGREGEGGRGREREGEGEIRGVIYRFFVQLIRINGLVIKVSCSEFVDLGSIPDEF